MCVFVGFSLDLRLDMAVQCSICLQHDTDLDWSVFNACGHVFHTVCINLALERSRRCPKCRVDIPKNLYYRKIFFETSDEPIGVSGDSGDAAGTAAAGQLQMKLLVKDQQLQQLKLGCRESEEKIKELEGKLSEAHNSVQKLQEKRDKYIGDLKTLESKSKASDNLVKNLKVKLNQAQLAETRFHLVTDTTLEGQSLDSELKRLMDKDVQVPDWFKGMLEVRNRQISAETNRAQRAIVDKQQAVGHHKYEIDKLQKQISKLRQQLDEREEVLANAKVAAVLPHWPEQTGNRQSQQKEMAMCTASGRKRRLNLGVHTILDTRETFDPVPGPSFPASARATLSLRQRMHKLSGKDKGKAAGLPAVRTSSSLAGFSPSRPTKAALAGGQQHYHENHSLAEEEMVVLEESEEQMQAEGRLHDDADMVEEGVEGGEREEPVFYSEVESEDELEVVDADVASNGKEQAGQPLPMPHLVLSHHGSDLGLARFAGSASLPQPHTAGSSSRDEQGRRRVTNVLQPTNTGGPNCVNLLPMKAGPSLMGAGRGTGPSFLRDPENANVGFDDQAKYIHRGPDGKGGTVSVFETGDTRPKAMQQSHIRTAMALNSAPIKNSKGWKHPPTARPAANGGCTIDLFFNKTS